MRFTRTCMAVCAVAALAGPAAADSVLINFEGVGDLQGVGSFYAGVGTTFSSAALAQRDVEAGGTGDFENEPSPDTTMLLRPESASDVSEAVMIHAAGFTGAFSYLYSSRSPAFVAIYPGVDRSDDPLATATLEEQHDNCAPLRPNFCNWTAVRMTFSGTAKSVLFRHTAAPGSTHWDNLEFNSLGSTPIPTPVPEPATWTLMALGLAGLGGLRYGARRQ